MTVSASRIRADFPTCPHVLLADSEFAVPTLRWLQGPFWNWFRLTRWSFNLDRWQRKNDCDNFARAYAQAAQDCHALSPGNDSEGLAVGEVFYTKASGGSHAIIVAYVGEDCARVFIEPQNNEAITLTEDEIKSAYFVRF